MRSLLDAITGTDGTKEESIHSPIELLIAFFKKFFGTILFLI